MEWWLTATYVVGMRFGESAFNVPILFFQQNNHSYIMTLISIFVRGISVKVYANNVKQDF